MEESDSDTSPADLDDEAPLYPIEGKFSSEADRQRIMGMTEIEREEILAERAAEVEKQAQDRQLKRLLQARKREEAQAADKKKRKAGAADLEDGERKSSRQKVKASAPLEAYKRQRELKGAGRARDVEARRDERSPSRDDGYSDRDAEGESEVEWDDHPQISAPKVEPPAELKDFQRVCVGRSNFAKVCFYPGFDELITGCFARVSIGMNRETGENMYRMTQIKGMLRPSNPHIYAQSNGSPGFKEGKPYQMEGPSGKPFVTDQYALVTHGSSSKEWPFLACSDGRFTDDEFDKYRAACAESNARMPSRKLLHQKLDDIHRLLNHQWTDAEIQAKIDRTARMQDKMRTAARERIVNRRNEASTRGDDATVAKCEAELAAMDGNGVAKKVAANTPNKATLQQERLAALNKANRKANSEEIRKAQLAEKRIVQKAREEAIARARKAEEEKAHNKLLGVDDLFGDGSDISRTGTPANGGLSGVGTPKRTGTPAGEKAVRKFGTLASKKKNMEDDVIASMDLGIDIDI